MTAIPEYGKWTYLAYIAFFTGPPLLFLWAFHGNILIKRMKTIFWSVLVLTAYGVFISRIGERWACWAFDYAYFSGVKLFGRSLETIVWWLAVSFLFSSFICVSAHYEDKRERILKSVLTFGVK